MTRALRRESAPQGRSNTPVMVPSGRARLPALALAPPAMGDRLQELRAQIMALERKLEGRSRPCLSLAAFRERPRPSAPDAATVTAARRLNRASGLLATSVLLDSAIEHYRGAFENRAMYTPLVVASLTLATSAHGHVDRREGRHALRDAIYSLAALTGVVGTGFHIYNVTKRPGGLSWQNLFYGAPVGAPMALLLAGLHGAVAERVRDNPSRAAPRLFGLPAGRAMAALTSAGLLGTAAEAGLLHLRGAYHNPFMFAPVTVPPVASALLANAAAGPRRERRFTRWWLRLTASLGFVGVGFHIYGVQRNMGGWRNWSQNVLNGPPIPAPPSFTGLALAGLAALGLMEDHPHA